MITKRIITILFLICAYLSTLAQVTIGVTTAPVSGSLLQLKENDGADANSTKGLTLPRVKLTNKTSLFPMFETTAGNNTPNTAYDEPQEQVAENNKHAGMVVYHVDNCTMQGKGLYVWSGTEWQKIGDQSPGGLILSETALDFPSGRDLRSAVLTKTFTVKWPPLTGKYINPTWTKDVGYSLEPNMTPASGTFTTSPQKMTVQVDPMTVDAITKNPFASERKTFTFYFGQCKHTRFITITQTNYALKANASLSNTIKGYTVVSNNSIAVQSNASWVVSKNDPHNLLLSTSPAIGTASGTESTLTTSSFVYNAAADGKYLKADLTFSDANNPKRFNDITVNLINCVEPTMEQWVSQLGTDKDEVAPNGMAWHKDQDNNIFFSMNYDSTNPKGSNNRWMVTNLAATSFATSDRTGIDNAVLQGFDPSPSSASNFLTPLWSYPSTTVPSSDIEFSKLKRLGRLYNWAAATNSLGGIVDGKDNPLNAQIGMPYPTHLKIQGICPNGWHLPSDYEWTEFENEMIKETATYSSIADIKGTPLVLTDNTSVGGRGTLHGSAMKDVCEPNISSGTSNSPIKGGFSSLLAGIGNDGRSALMGVYGYFWGSSTSSKEAKADTAWFRSISNTSSVVFRSLSGRTNLFSVRCKKDK